MEPGSPPGRKPSRTASSASLALMGTSIGKVFAGAASLDRQGWGAPKRSESTTSLSGMVAVGRILPSTVSSTSNTVSSETTSMPPPSLPNTMRKSERHKIPSPTSILRPSSSASSPSSASNSSFAPSHFSSHPSNISTAGSSDHNSHSNTRRDTSRSPTGLTDMSSSAGSGSYGEKVDRGRAGGRSRGLKGLMMTPSASSGGDSSVGDPTLDQANVNGGTSKTSERSRSQGSESRSDVSRRSSGVDNGGHEDQKTPTQSLRDYKGTVVTRNKSRTDLPESGPEGVRTTVAGGSDDVVEDRSRNGTIKKRSKQLRALSSPSTDIRPTRLDLLLSSTALPSPILGRHAQSQQQLYPNATVLNPALDHLRSESRDRSPNLTSKARNWSWDQLHVPTYPTLDLEKVRREKALMNGSEGGKGEVVQVTEKKKLFYFDDAGE